MTCMAHLFLSPRTDTAATWTPQCWEAGWLYGNKHALTLTKHRKLEMLPLLYVDKEINYKKKGLNLALSTSYRQICCANIRQKML